MAIDHVLLAVSDLGAAAAQLRERHGLTALPGGRHPGAGTANMIVPLGPDYLELIAIVDPAEAEGNPLSRRVSGAIARGATFATWAVRVPDLDLAKRVLASQGIESLGPRDGSRQRPDGVLLRWRTLHVGEGLEPAIPFLIEWNLPAGEHPGQRTVVHPAGRVTLRSVRLTARYPASMGERIRRLVGPDVAFTVLPGLRDEVAALVLDLDGEERELK